MKISDIKQQVKRSDRYSIYIEGKYTFSLSELELMNSGLRVGKEYGEVELAELKNTALIDKAYDRALNYVAIRQRSEWELREYLKRKEYDSPTIDLILNRLSISGYVNDLKFAEAWVSNRRLLKATSRRRLLQELRQKHISSDVIEQVLAEDETDDRAVLRELVAKKRQQSRYQDNLKLMQYLARQGYNYEDIKAVLTGKDAAD